MSRLINQSLARKLAIASANERSVRIYGVAKFTRCSQAFLDAVEAEVTNVIHRRAAELWQKGKTLT